MRNFRCKKTAQHPEFIAKMRQHTHHMRRFHIILRGTSTPYYCTSKHASGLHNNTRSGHLQAFKVHQTQTKFRFLTPELRFIPNKSAWGRKSKCHLTYFVRCKSVAMRRLILVVNTSSVARCIWAVLPPTLRYSDGTLNDNF